MVYERRSTAAHMRHQALPIPASRPQLTALTPLFALTICATGLGSHHGIAHADDGVWKDPGTALDPRFEKRIYSDTELEQTLRDPKDPNYFGALVYSVVRHIRDPKPEHRPLLFVPAIGGGADIATAISMAMWHIDRLSRHPEVRQAYKERHASELDYDTFVSHQLLEPLFLTVAEKRVSHHDAAFRHETRRPSYAFYDGSLIGEPGGLWPLVGGQPVVVHDPLSPRSTQPEGNRRTLRQISGVTPQARFRHQAVDVSGNAVVFDGEPIEDHRLVGYAHEMTGAKTIYELSLHGGSVNQARDDTALLVREHATVNPSALPDGSKEPTPQRRRPVFAAVIDPGADSFVKHDRRGLPASRLVSEANEAFCWMALRQLIRQSGMPADYITPAKWLIAPGPFSLDGESSARSCNDALAELSAKRFEAIGGLMVPPLWITLTTLRRVFGFGDQPPLLQSNANRQTNVNLARRWLSDAARGDLSGATAHERTQQALVRPLRVQKVASVARKDLPGLSQDTHIGDPTSEFVFLAPLPALQYLERKLRLPSSIRDASHAQVGTLIEKLHLVDKENTLSSAGEYELLKAVLAASVPHGLYRKLPRTRRMHLIPRDVQGAFSHLEAETLSPAHGGLSDTQLMAIESRWGANGQVTAHTRQLARAHAQRFVDDALAIEGATTGRLKLNARFVLEYLRGDYPALYEHLRDNRQLTEQIVAMHRRLFGEGLLSLLRDARIQPARLDQHQAAPADRGIDLDTELLEAIERGNQGGSVPRQLQQPALRRAKMALHILRINPRVAQLLFEARKIGMKHIFASACTSYSGASSRRSSPDASVSLSYRPTRAHASCCSSATCSARGISSGAYEKVLKALGQMTIVALDLGDRAGRPRGRHATGERATQTHK
jgi:hypothetical protein